MPHDVNLILTLAGGLSAALVLGFITQKLRLGTWQSVYLREGDGPRRRNLWLQWLKSDD